MQVFKLYFKVLKKYIGFIFMYVGIFFGLMSAIIGPAMKGTNTSNDFVNSVCDFAVFDEDGSELSQGIVSYLESTHNKVEIKDYEHETLQDELYARNVDAVVVIHKGFEVALAQGKAKDYLTVYEIPGVTTAMLFKQNINSFLLVTDTYVTAGFDTKEAVEGAIASQKQQVTISLPDGTDNVAHGSDYFYFTYIAWIFVAMCITAITPVLLVFNKKLIRDRIAISSYPFSRLNLETLLGVLLTGVMICVAFNVGGISIAGKSMFTTNGLLYICNVFCYMMVALAFSFTISKCTENPQIISVLANVVSLGMAFLCGIFVPMELLSDTVIKIAHFLPAYWYEKAVMTIEHFTTSDLGSIFLCMGMELLFACVIAIIGMIVSKKKQIA